MFSDNQLSAILTTLNEASEIIMDVYNGFDPQTKYKEDNSPLTIADTKSNEHICKKLTEIFANIPILSEENKVQDFKQRQSWNKLWSLDPLDGTKEFIKKNGEFSINLCLIENQRPTAGFIMIPAKDIIYYAIKDQGCFKVENNQTTKISLRKSFESKNEIKIITSRSHINETTQKFIDSIAIKYPEKKVSTVPAGSALKFTLLAENQADIYPRLAPTMEWDICAGDIILSECGLSLKTEDGNEMLYNRENLVNPSFICK